jgi:hypothetical protein
MRETERVTTLMWEAKAAPGRDGELVAHALRHADPQAQIYRSADGRVVVIDPSGLGLPDADDDLLARPAHSWRFERVPREGTGSEGCST